MPGISDRPRPPHVQAWRKILNEVWPERPASFRRRDDLIKVRVRVVFERDGETWLEGKAVRWDARHVYVEVNDRRFTTNGVWLRPADVYRAGPAELPPK